MYTCLLRTNHIKHNVSKRSGPEKVFNGSEAGRAFVLNIQKCYEIYQRGMHGAAFFLLRCGAG